MMQIYPLVLGIDGHNTNIQNFHISICGLNLGSNFM